MNLFCVMLASLTKTPIFLSSRVSCSNIFGKITSFLKKKSTCHIFKYSCFFAGFAKHLILLPSTLLLGQIIATQLDIYKIFKKKILICRDRITNILSFFRCKPLDAKFLMTNILIVPALMAQKIHCASIVCPEGTKCLW